MNYYYNKSQLISSVRNSYQQELHLNCLTSTKEVAVTYSASVEEGVTIGCFFEKQATTLDPNSKKKKKIYHMHIFCYQDLLQNHCQQSQSNCYHQIYKTKHNLMSLSSILRSFLLLINVAWLDIPCMHYTYNIHNMWSHGS